MRKINIILLSHLIASQAIAREVDISDRINAHQIYMNSYKSVFGVKQIKSDEEFKKSLNALDDEKKISAKKLIQLLDKKLPSELLKPIVFWKEINPDEANLKKSLIYAMFYYLSIYRDYLESPQSKGQTVLLNNLRKILKNEELSQNNLFKYCLEDIKEKASLLSELDDITSFANAIKQTEYFNENIFEDIPDPIHYSLDPRGFIPGNKIQIISENKRDLDRIEWFNERIIFGGKSLDFNSPHIAIPENGAGHISLVEDPIFIKIKEMIDEAHESIFIDIFLFGGTLGATLAEHLIKTTKLKLAKNPNFKVLLLHDFATHYTIIDEMMPIFEYLKNVRNEDPLLAKSFYLLQANIHRHPPGIPFNVTNLVPKTDDVYEAMQEKSTYYESKIDHSKVIVIDANTDSPQAYFGSKNWSDHSGGYYYDDAIWVQGPAAALVQHSYYDDIEAALTTNPQEQRLFFYKDKGFDNREYLPIRNKVLKEFKISRTNFKIQGDEVIRFAESSVDGRLKNVRNIIIDSIISAKSTIYMEQLFLYDSYVVDALIKKKIKNPSIQIKILVDHNGNFGMNGLPNTIFLRELKQYGIEIRARKTLGTEITLPDGTKKSYHQENHRKIISIDGEVLIGGSSNINPDTLQGSFREFGAQIFNKEEIQKFEKRFLIDWSDHEKVSEVDIENFQARIAGKSLSKRLSDFINKIAAQLIRSKDALEKRN